MSKRNRAAKRFARIANSQNRAAAPGRSTGPRTPEGKAASSQNARKHGFTAKSADVPEEERAEHELFRDSLVDQLRPEGPLEWIVFERLLRSAWNMRRIEEFRDAIFHSPGLLRDEQLMKEFDRFTRYHTTNERSFYRAMKELENLQAKRARRPEPTPEETAEETPAPAPEHDFAKRTPPASPQWHSRLDPDRPKPDPHPIDLPRKAASTA